MEQLDSNVCGNDANESHLPKNILIEREIRRGMARLEALLEAAQEGDFHEVGDRLLDTSRALSEHLKEGFTALKQYHERNLIRRVDASRITEFVAERIATHRHYGNPVAVAIFRIELADDVQDAAEILQSMIRVTDRAFMMSDREILIVLPETGLTGSRVFALRAANEAVEQLGTRIFAGVTTVLPADDVNSMMERADEALYRAQQDDFCFVYSNDGEQVQQVNERDWTIS